MVLGEACISARDACVPACSSGSGSKIAGKKGAAEASRAGSDAWLSTGAAASVINVGTGSTTADWDGACAGDATREEAGGSCTASGRVGGDARPVSGVVQTSTLLRRGGVASAGVAVVAVSVADTASAAAAAGPACLTGDLPFFPAAATTGSAGGGGGAAGERA